MKGKSKAKATHWFVATIYKLWMMRHVDVPDKVARSLAKELAASSTSTNSSRVARSSKKTKPLRVKYIPAFATVNGKEARVTLVPAGGGRYRVQLNTALRKAARADAGDEVSVTLRLDRESREPTVPSDLRMALKENPEARKIFEALTTGHRRHIVDWFDSARGMDTRIRRLGFTIDFLLKRGHEGSRDRRRDPKRRQLDE
jgi:Bacteriocin-protection, YdeI or OmpD-Associated/Domain of unknown function (DUF1905)